MKRFAISAGFVGLAAVGLAVGSATNITPPDLRRNLVPYQLDCMFIRLGNHERVYNQSGKLREVNQLDEEKKRHGVCYKWHSSLGVPNHIIERTEYHHGVKHGVNSYNASGWIHYQYENGKPVSTSIRADDGTKLSYTPNNHPTEFRYVSK